jgi:hypothetical protein
VDGWRARELGGRQQRELGREVCLGREGVKVSRAWGCSGLWDKSSSSVGRFGTNEIKHNFCLPSLSRRKLSFFSSARIGRQKILFLRQLLTKPTKLIVADVSFQFSCSVIKLTD